MKRRQQSKVYYSQKLPHLKLEVREPPFDKAVATEELLRSVFGSFILWKQSRSAIVLCSSRSAPSRRSACVPRPRCAPEHSRQSSVPKVTDAHCGAFVGQSAHTSFPGTAKTAARSAASICTALVE